MGMRHSFFGLVILGLAGTVWPTAGLSGESEARDVIVPERTDEKAGRCTTTGHHVKA